MKIGILSRNASLYSTNALIEAARERDHEVQVFDHLHCSLSLEKDKPKVYYKGIPLDYLDAIIPRIGSSATFFGSNVIRQFEMMGTKTTTSANALLDSRDKFRSLQLLSRAGLGLPKTVFTNFGKNTDSMIQAVGGAPLIIKMLEGTQGLGVILADTHSAASSVIEAMHGLQARVVVQEYIRESKGVDIRAFVVDGKVVAAMRRSPKQGEFRSNLHRGGKANAIRLRPEQEEAALTATKVLGLKVAGVDMLQSYRGPLIIEVNASPGLEGIETTTGVDVAATIIQLIEKL